MFSSWICRLALGDLGQAILSLRLSHSEWGDGSGLRAGETVYQGSACKAAVGAQHITEAQEMPGPFPRLRNVSGQLLLEGTFSALQRDCVLLSPQQPL